MRRRKLEELNLLDDFLFGSMVTHPEIGEKFMRELLRVIFQRDFGKLKVIPQKVYYGSDTDKHGARLDVYLEEEEPDMPYDDGARTLFLYTKGKRGNPPEELRQLLHYMEDTKKENAQNESLRSIHEMVEAVKGEREVSLEYMKIFEREEMLVRQGIKEGRKEEQKNTEREKQRADSAERELERLRKELEELKHSK